MSDLPSVSFIETDLDAINSAKGRIVVFVPGTGKLDRLARRVNRLTRGALQRFAESEAFGKMKEGDSRLLSFPTGLEADSLLVIRMERQSRGSVARKAGASIGRGVKGPALVLAGSMRGTPDVLLGTLLRAYRFDAHLTGEDDAGSDPTELTLMVSRPDDMSDAAESALAVAEGVWFTRDLVNEPSNVLTTTEFADRLVQMEALGLKVQVLDEAELAELGMRTLLAVGQMMTLIYPAEAVLASVFLAHIGLAVKLTYENKKKAS